MQWKDYEIKIFKELEHRYSDCKIIHNAKIVGATSQTPRQIDILIEGQVLDSPIRIIVDAKQRTKPVDINDVESFISMMIDVKAHRGILISTNGYTKAAIQRAHNEKNQDIELDVLSIKELKELQGELAIPFSGKHGVLLRAPFGWVVDAKKRDKLLATLYQRGYDFQQAAKEKEWLYVNFWQKETPEQNLKFLLKHQQETTLQDANIEFLSGVNRTDAETIIRVATVPDYPTPEYTGFVEFDDFIFFAVLFSKGEMAKRNLRKLREILRTVLPIDIKQYKVTRILA